ncbi:MAG: type II secretion system protein [Bacillus sp. (in: firmicutes)]
MVQALKLKMKEQKGFTLIELLAVIVILGIIAAIAIPAITSVINKSDAKAEAQDKVQIINAARMYVANEKADATEIKRSDLEKEYLDRIDTDDVFVIKVTTVGTGGKEYTYFSSSTATTGEKEADLIKAAK